MKLTLSDPRLLKDSITIISELVTEARFSVTKDAVELVAMDPANVAMVIFKLLSSSFVEFTVPNDTELAINLDNLKKVLRRAGPRDLLTLEMEDEAKLKVEIKGKSVRTFHIPIIDMEDREQRVPQLEFPIAVTMPATMLDEAIEDVDIVAESVAFKADPKQFIVSAEGDLSQAKIEMAADEDVSIDANETATFQSRYSIEYLKKLIKGSKLADDVTIRFNNDYPLKIEFKAVDKVLLAFILAPRVENN